jgi:hypothetical protein
VAGRASADVDWVRNVRAAREITLRRAGRSETHRPVEVPAEEAVAVLRQYLHVRIFRYLQRVRILPPLFGIGPDSTDEEIAAEAPRHPVFRLLLSAV